MVTHHPQRACGHGHPKVDLGGAIAGEDVGLVELGPVDVHMAASALNGVAPDTDNPLDEVALAGRGREADGCQRIVNRTMLHGCHRSWGQPPGGVLEHDDVAAMNACYVGDQLVD